MTIQSATLKPREERRLLRGHLWAYRNEFQQLPPLDDGAQVDVFSADRRFVGRGFYQAEGGIAVRLLSRRQETIDAAFLTARLDDAQAFRARLFPGATAYRWVHAESDRLPGLVVDRFGGAVVVSTLCRFYDEHRRAIAEHLLAWEDVQTVCFDAPGGAEQFGVPVECADFALQGLQFSANLRSGQKTGFFLDQRMNALGVRSLAAGARVLDGHCYVGAWSCNAAKAGALDVLGVDTSPAAIERAGKHAEINSVAGQCRFECAPIEQVLARGDQYDLVILDPPAFAKARAHTAKALTRYQALNTQGMQAVKPGGILITSSCSHFVDMPAFLEVLKRAATSARRQVWILSEAGASPDHPVLMAMPETAYLKCVTLRVL